MIRPTTRSRALTFIAAAAVAAWAAGAGSDVDAARTIDGGAYTRSMVALGHSWTTGYDSEGRGLDALQNSWVTGTNPAVRSVYRRLLAVSPAIRGHNVNLGIDGATLKEIAVQVRTAIQLKPAPELVILQGIDNDIECDGQDATRYAAYRDRLTTQLRALSKGLPKARIFVISQPVSVRAWVAMIGQLDPAQRGGGSGPCDAYDSSGNLVPEHVDYQARVVAAYLARTAAACARVPRCHYDGGAAQKITFTPNDITPDQSHPSVSGAAKLAAAEWAAMKRLGIVPS